MSKVFQVLKIVCFFTICCFQIFHSSWFIINKERLVRHMMRNDFVSLISTENSGRCRSIYHFIVWIFLIEDRLTDDQVYRIQRLYGEQFHIFNPNPKNLEEFKSTLQIVKKQCSKSQIKVVCEESLALAFMQHFQNDHQILEIYKYTKQSVLMVSSFIRETSFISVKGGKKLLKPSNKVRPFFQGVVMDLDKIISRAQKEVEYLTKSYRTFNNSMCLVGDFAERANRYRFRLISCIDQKVSDLDDNLELFSNFALREFPELSHNWHAIRGNYLSIPKMHECLALYKQKASQFIQNQKKKAELVNNIRLQNVKKVRESQQKEKEDKNRKKASLQQSMVDILQEQTLVIDKLDYERKRIEFYKDMIRLYQQEGIFYHLLNNGLRNISDKNAVWQPLSLPFSHLYNAIKTLHLAAIKSKDKFYTNDFTVYRAGRIRKSELEEYQQYGSNVYIEFFGFLSTSLSLQVVAEQFLSPNQIKSGIEENDESCIVKITCRYNDNMREQKYDFLRHGFFKLSNKQNKQKKQPFHDKEKEVLFNGLNIYKLVGVSKKTIYQMSTSEEKKNINAKIKNVQAKSQSKYYNEVTVIELELGPFFDIIIDQNIILDDRQKIAKKNYLFCMKKIKKCERFDRADAYELTNEVQRSYNYLKQKINSQQSKDAKQRFKISRLDNKNYYSRISSICGKLGKIKEGLNTSKLSIKCYKQLEKVHFRNIYNAHYEKWCEMKKRIIDIYFENGNYIAAQDELQRQLDYIKSRQFTQPKAKLRQSEIILNQAVTDFYVGKLGECIDKFKNCSQGLQGAIQTINNLSLDVIIKCYCFEYIGNIFSGYECVSYKQFGRLLVKRKENELIRQLGGKQDLKKTDKIANELNGMATESIRRQMKCFKNQSEFEKLITKFNRQISSSVIEKLEDENPEQRNLEQEMKTIMKDVLTFNASIESEQYKQLYNDVKKRCEELRDKQNLRINMEGIDELNFIEKFKERERKRKLEHLEKTKEKVLRENQRRLIDEYMEQTREIDRIIEVLKEDGYVDSTIVLLKKRNEKADLFFKSDRRREAIQEINIIIREGKQEGEERNNQLADAFLTQGKIMLQIGQYKQAIHSFSQSIHYYQKTVNQAEQSETDEKEGEQDMEGDFSSTQEGTERALIDKKTVEQKEKDRRQILQYNDNYLLSKMLKAKAMLSSMDLLNIIYIRPRDSQQWSNINSQDSNKMSNQDILYETERVVNEVQKIIRQRDEVQKMDLLMADLKELKGNYLLRESAINHREGFKYFKECFKIRDQLFGVQNNSLNVATCFEIIFQFFENHSILDMIVEHNFLDIISTALCNYNNCNFFWKISKAFFLVEYYRENGNKGLAVQRLQESIQFLQNMEKDQYLDQEYQKLLDFQRKVKRSYIDSEGNSEQEILDLMKSEQSRQIMDNGQEYSKIDILSIDQQQMFKQSIIKQQLYLNFDNPDPQMTSSRDVNISQNNFNLLYHRDIQQLRSSIYKNNVSTNSNSPKKIYKSIPGKRVQKKKEEDSELKYRRKDLF